MKRITCLSLSSSTIHAKHFKQPIQMIVNGNGKIIRVKIPLCFSVDFKNKVYEIDLINGLDKKTIIPKEETFLSLQENLFSKIVEKILQGVTDELATKDNLKKEDMETTIKIDDGRSKKNQEEKEKEEDSVHYVPHEIHYPKKEEEKKSKTKKDLLLRSVSQQQPQPLPYENRKRSNSMPPENNTISH